MGPLHWIARISATFFLGLFAHFILLVVLYITLRISCEKTGEGHRQLDEHWNCFKGNTGPTSERTRTRTRKL